MRTGPERRMLGGRAEFLIRPLNVSVISALFACSTEYPCESTACADARLISSSIVEPSITNEQSAPSFWQDRVSGIASTSRSGCL